MIETIIACAICYLIGAAVTKIQDLLALKSHADADTPMKIGDRFFYLISADTLSGSDWYKILNNRRKYDC